MRATRNYSNRGNPGITGTYVPPYAEFAHGSHPAAQPQSERGAGGAFTFQS